MNAPPRWVSSELALTAREICDHSSEVAGALP
jgi:hypothetical protein